jgi:hypothetical protein
LRAVFALTSFIDRKRSPHEKLIVEFADRFLGLRAVAEFHKCKTARLTRFAIERKINVGKRADGRKVLA